MKYYALIYRLYTLLPVRIARFGILVVLWYVLWDSYMLGKSIQQIIGYLLFYVSVEIFFHFKIARVVPRISVAHNTGIIEESCTLGALYWFVGTSTPIAVRHMLNDKAIAFMLQRSGIEKKEVLLMNLTHGEIFSRACELVKEINGEFVTEMDVFAAYILLFEHDTKLLFHKELKEQDWIEILRWTRITYPEKEKRIPVRVTFWGEGIGEVLTSGWTPETTKYTQNYSYAALAKKPVLIGLGQEYQRMLEALARGENNNVLVVGESGSGKDTLIETFAMQSFMGVIGGRLNHMHLYELLLGPLLAGAENENVLATRLQAIIDEIVHSGNGILVIPEFQNVLTTKTSSSISGILMPYLRNGRLPIIATMTMGYYKQSMEQDPLKEVFEVIKIGQLDQLTTLQILYKKAITIEEKERVIISYKALRFALQYANKYFQEKILPGSALGLLEDVAHSKNIASGPVFDHYHKKIVQENDVIQKIEEKT